MNIALFCLAISLMAGITGATPRNSALMAGIIAFVAGAVAFSVDDPPLYWTHSYRTLILAFLFALPAAVMSFTIAKLKR